MVCGESGAGKTTFVGDFVTTASGSCRVLWGACDPLTTPRPLGPLHDLADRFDAPTRDQLRLGAQPYDIFAAAFDDLRRESTILVLDDLQWADQATIDLCRFLLRRSPQSSLLTIGIVRDDEVSATHPLRSLLGDVARSPHAQCLTLPPLTVSAVAELIGDRGVDAGWLHRFTGGNAFFVCEMLDHNDSSGSELPTTIRDAILARTADLDAGAWDLLNLLTCAPGAIGDHLLTSLGVTLTALRALDEAKLIRRDARGVTFRHDLCRRAVTSVIPPGAEPELHRRFIQAHRDSGDEDAAVLTHHALGAGDRQLITTSASHAGRAAARSGAHTQACEFFEVALSRGAPLPGADSADLLERLATEYYLVDRLDDAITACRDAMRIRHDLQQPVAVSANHHALAVYEWYNGNRALADDHIAQAIAGVDCEAARHNPSGQLHRGHALATQAFLAVQSTQLDLARTIVGQAREIAGARGDPSLTVRLDMIDCFCAILSGDSTARKRVLALLAEGPRHIDDVYSTGYTNLTYFDVEERRLDDAADLLDLSIPLMVEHDLPICHVVQVGSRGRLNLLIGEWDRARADADTVLDSPSAPLARIWPLLIRGLLGLRCFGDDGGDIDQAWELASRFGEPVRLLPTAAAVAERCWLTGATDPRVSDCEALLAGPPSAGLGWARGELATWLRRIGSPVVVDDVAEPYARLAAAEHRAASRAFHRLSGPYDAALALVDAADTELTCQALDLLDRLGAEAVAAKVRSDLRTAGVTAVPRVKRATTRANPAGLTARQVEVLRLLGDGLTNAELAQRLFLSVKTVDHHVSAILTKLEVAGRRDAVRRGREVGLLTSPAASTN